MQPIRTAILYLPDGDEVEVTQVDITEKIRTPADTKCEYCIFREKYMCHLAAVSRAGYPTMRQGDMAGSPCDRSTPADKVAVFTSNAPLLIKEGVTIKFD